MFFYYLKTKRIAVFWDNLMMGTGAVFQCDCVDFSPFIARFSACPEFLQ